MQQNQAFFSSQVRGQSNLLGHLGRSATITIVMIANGLRQASQIPSVYALVLYMRSTKIFEPCRNNHN